MRKILPLILTALLILSYSCKKSEQGRPEMKASSAQAEHGGQDNPQAKPGQKPGTKAEAGEIDVDKLDIPDQLKEAIKSGKIPPDQVQEMLARFQSGGDAVPVSVEQVKRTDLNSYLVLNGIVEPERLVEIYSRLSAYVKQIVKEEGEYVKENEVLATLDDTEIRISYQQAQIQLDQAKLALDEESKNYERSKELMKRELISEQEFQASEGLHKQRQLELEDREESFKNLQLQLNWTRIRSLSSGYITERMIEVGTKVNANQQVYTVEDFDPLLVRVFVPTSDAIKLQPGMDAEVTTEIIEGAQFNGKVKLINPRIDVQTGTVKVTVEVRDETLRVKPGMFVEVRIVIGMKEDVLSIPRKAILYKQNKTYVFVTERGQVSQREVTLGLTEEDQVEVLDGLTENETIVTVGVESLKDGQRIEVVR